MGLIIRFVSNMIPAAENGLKSIKRLAATGKNVLDAIRHFGAQRKLFKIHFRNVSGTLPRFFETFPDDGYQDMPRVMRTLREVGFNGSVIADHIPQMINDTGLQQAGAAYCVGYMRALLRQANREVG